MTSARIRLLAGLASTAFNLGLIALVMRTGAEAPPMREELIMTAELVAVRGGEISTPAPSARAESLPRQPAPSLPQAAPTAPTAEDVAAPAQPAMAQAPAPPSTAPTSRPPAPVAQRAGTREGLDLDAPRGESLNYAAQLRAWLEAHKTYPKRARMRREEGIVEVAFAVDRQGRLLTGDVVRSSGHASLDAEAMAMLDRSNPFPGAPHSVRGERIEVSTPVEFSLQR
ncbi:MAG: TonB family protein [Phenylobacterium sp.]|uniref:energy transducer TonB n=1 Tax=Phenylobacterium sp. TaxID=1871053 RepID=UPI002734225A|nr:energy transducer TonB [Phenylobacterium sp.]MDP3749117.1 TonB family protein [Phenylobacterium sp.]